MSDSVSRLNLALDGRYNVERELGEGGMATVYLVRRAQVSIDGGNSRGGRPTAVSSTMK